MLKASSSLSLITARPRLRRALAWLAGLFLAYGVIGFFLLPPLLRPALERNLSAVLERKVTIAQLKTNPFALSVTLSGVAVGERGEGPPMLTLDELYVAGGVGSLFRWAPVINELKLTRPLLNLVRNEDKSYNF